MPMPTAAREDRPSEKMYGIDPFEAREADDVELPGEDDGAQVTDIQDLENVDEVIDTVLARAKQAADYRRPFEEEWHRNIMAMFQVLYTEKESSWQSQRYMPIILSNVETALSVIGSVVVENPKLVRLNSQTPQGRDHAAAQEALLEWQSMGPCKIPRKLLEQEWWALVTGTGMMDTGWTEKDELVGTMEVRDGVDGGNPSKVYVEKMMKVEDWPKIKVLNPLDVYLCPDAGYGTEHPWWVQRARVRLSDLQAVAGKGHIDKERLETWIEDIKPTDGQRSAMGEFHTELGPRLWDIWLEEVGRARPQRGAPDDADDPVIGDKIVEILVYRSERETITLGSTSHLLGYSKNRHIHRLSGLVTNGFMPIPGCPYARSLASLLLGHQELVNQNVNLFADTMMVSMMRPMVIDRSLISVLDTDEILEPNSLIKAKMNAPNAIVPLNIPAPTNLFVLWDQHLRKDADDTSGFTDQARGIAPANSPTATEFSGIQANIQNRLKIHVLRLRWFVEDLFGVLVKLNQQFYTNAQVISITGETGIEYRRVEPWEIVGDVLVQATMSPKYANQDMHAQRMMMLLQPLAPILSGQVPLTPPLRRFLRSLLKTANVDDVDRILPSENETVRSPVAENAAMYRGVKLEPSVAEHMAGLGMSHINDHSTFLAAISEDPNVPESVKAIVTAHLRAHMVLEQQMGGAMQGAGVPGQQQGAQPPGAGGAPVREEATMLGNAAGAQGTPGRASPGPAGVPGRPMGV